MSTTAKWILAMIGATVASFVAGAFSGSEIERGVWLEMMGKLQLSPACFDEMKAGFEGLLDEMEEE
ncbi:hypothetical protein V6C03_05805 [Methyloligella sp. 2.7D]|uniref:hypothetical protein n=1 Tax=unclassified Methyloligella TaxID=2625955 RepID=UPI00157D78F7|nr:hypothetical protein [Methyloligella sp. GL2]QKP78565.1 hypothetical protein HT051_14645 [Methyloligella sp. GL2]